MAKKFEYKTERIDSKSIWSIKFDSKEIDEILNQIGSEGWELVSVQDISQTGTAWSFHYTFKREL